MADDLARLQGALAGRYTVQRELGRGGMATVYLAQDLKHHRSVAIKVLRPELAAALGPERFLREITITAQLDHPNILPLLDSGQTGGGPDASGRGPDASGRGPDASGPYLYYVMPFVEGESLRDRLTREKQLRLDQALQITREVADALGYAHARGVIHRDIKPENILLSGGHARVADFGIARAISAAGTEKLTETGLAVGTPSYMSPEQSVGEGDLDGRSDLYALGCVLYEMLAGEPPYTGPSVQAIVAKRFREPVPRVSTLRETVPPEVEAALVRVLAKSPADRFSTAEEFAEALVRSGVRGERHLPLGMAILGIGLALSLGLLYAWRQSHRGGEATGPEHLAVLPFENQGDSADAYFADGVTDELRGKLAAVPGLEVVASRSSNDYRGTTKSLPEIARDLGVAYLLIGKIRWQKGAGSVGRVRVSPELIRVAPGVAPTTKWAQSFDAALTDVFQVQADIASRVAEALDVALGAGVPEAMAARPTTSTEAYDDYLRANEFADRSTVPDLRLAVQLYHQALTLDSTFALAWARLAEAESALYQFRADRSPEQLGRAEQAARRALALAPDLAEAHVAMGYYHYQGHRDFARALEEFALASRSEPNDAELVNVVGRVLRRQGKWDQAVANLRRATELDPRSYTDLADLGETYLMMRDYPEAERALLRAAALAPDWPVPYGHLTRLYLNRDGSLEKPRDVMRQALSRITFGRLLGATYRELGWRTVYAQIAAADAYQRDVAALTPAVLEDDTLGYFTFKASVYRYRGERARARAYDDSTHTEALALIAGHEDDAFTYGTLAVADAYLGRGKEAIEAGRRAVDILPTSKDAMFGQEGPMALAEVYTALGDTDAALDQLEGLLAVPSFVSAAQLRADPVWASLRGNPRFERLTAGK